MLPHPGPSESLSCQLKLVFQNSSLSLPPHHIHSTHRLPSTLPSDSQWDTDDSDRVRGKRSNHDPRCPSMGPRMPISCPHSHHSDPHDQNLSCPPLRSTTGGLRPTHAQFECDAVSLHSTDGHSSLSPHPQSYAGLCEHAIDDILPQQRCGQMALRWISGALRPIWRQPSSAHSYAPRPCPSRSSVPAKGRALTNHKHSLWHNCAEDCGSGLWFRRIPHINPQM